MVSKSYIYSNLKQLDVLYNQARTQKEKLYYSKLAMLELCGWIEESMDDIIKKCANRVLKVEKNKKYVADIIKKTNGFGYDEHFRRMLISVVGLVSIEKIEKKVDPSKYCQFTAALNNLKSARNREAHTHLKGTTRIVDSPSLTIGNFQHVYEGLKEFETKLKELNL
jgi:cystathionine beta-lyase family protein involved in aluminum resistance